MKVYLSLTSSPSSPRAEVSLPLSSDSGEGGACTSPAELRKKASEATSVPLSSMRLIFRGRVIPDRDEGDVVREFKLEDGCVVHVMGKPAGGGGGGAAAANGTANGTASGAGATNGAGGPAGASVTLPPAMGGMNLDAAASAAPSSASPLAAALGKLRSSNDGAAYGTALTTADKLLGNIVSHPMEEKYRTIKKSNPAFSKRLGSVPGGSDLLLASGFTVENREDVEYYVLTPSADAWPTLVAAREEVGRVLGEVNRGSSAAPVVPPPFPGSAAPAGMPNLFPGGMPGGMTGGTGGMPDMSAMQSMMNDPNMMQSALGMMNNPMVQNMLRNDPRFANNPMMQQSLDALQRNPDMINQMSQMMNDPNVRNQMANMMQQQGMGGGGGGTDPFANGPEAMRRQMEQFQQMSQMFGGSSGSFNAGGSGGGTAANNASGAGQGSAPGAGNGNNNAGSGGQGGGGNDSEMTEEEMIAEAIARSLRES